MKQHKRTKGSPSIDPDFADLLDDDRTEGSSAGRQAERKTQQFCRQVQRSLNLAMADLAIGSIYIEDVIPAPDCGRLLVQVVAPDGVPLAEAIAILRRETSRLRAEVASAITRKRAPELHFIPAIQDGGIDE